jgi:hypothetical protein
VSATVAGLIAVVAVLGTTVYFMSGNSANLIQMPAQEGQLTQSQSQPSQSEDSTTSMTMEQECAQYGISQSNCDEITLLAAKRTMASQTTIGSESIKLSNAHSWVASNGDATTAFVVQNTGSKATTINSINLRGVSVPTSDWFYSISSDSAVLQTELKVDHTEDSVVLGSQLTAMNTGSISLAPSQAAIVYLNEAGNIEAIDAGNTYSLQIQAGQATAVQQVQVVTG